MTLAEFPITFSPAATLVILSLCCWFAALFLVLGADWNKRQPLLDVCLRATIIVAIVITLAATVA